MPDKNFRSLPLPLPAADQINADLFWAQVDKKEPHECWLWKGALSGNGYGYFRVNYRPLVATRLSYYLTYGEDPLYLVVRHKCDNPPCVNPLHLELGTQKENMQDAVLRGRLNMGDKNGSRTKPETKALGEKNGQSKLNDALAITIRERFAAGESMNSLGQQFGVYYGTIQKIVRGWTYKHVGGPIQTGSLENRRNPGILTREQAQQVIDMRVDGFSGDQICEELQISQGAVWPILYNRAWKDLDRSKLTKREPKKQISKTEWPAILSAHQAGEAVGAIALRYGVGRTGIFYILRQARESGGPG